VDVCGAVDARHVPTDAATTRLDIVHDINALRKRLVSSSVSTPTNPTHLIALGIKRTRLESLGTESLLNDVLARKIDSLSQSGGGCGVRAAVIEALACQYRISSLFNLDASRRSPEIQRSGALPEGEPSIETHAAPPDPQRRLPAPGCPQFRRLL
jgi:hypothetical protein